MRTINLPRQARDKNASGTAEKRPGVFPAGYNHGSRAEILAQYQVGRPIQWGAFTSVTTVRGKKHKTKHLFHETRSDNFTTTGSGQTLSLNSNH
jgi:hypothetical protein